jgi:hypothetical protein
VPAHRFRRLTRNWYSPGPDAAPAIRWVTNATCGPATAPPKWKVPPARRPYMARKSCRMSPANRLPSRVRTRRVVGKAYGRCRNAPSQVVPAATGPAARA